jgi:hypothetical protein
MIKITLTDLPKVSNNKFYSGMHWTKRKELKDLMTLKVKSQCKRVFSKDEKYIVGYDFEFKGTPLDASNCMGMLKMIEDILFQDDKWDIIDLGGITSRKGKQDKVTITIEIKGDRPYDK